MATHDIQLALHAHLNHASLATTTQDLTKHLDAFTRDWKLEPSLEQFDSALGLLRESAQSSNLDTIAIWWIGFIQDIVLTDHISHRSTELKEALVKAVDPLADYIQNPNKALSKRAIQACASIYPVVFQICCQDTPKNVSLWNDYSTRIKQLILAHFSGASNEGIMLSACKYIQTVIQTQSRSQPNSLPQEAEALALSMVPVPHPFLNVAKLQQESDRLLQDLLSVIRRSEVSSTIITAIINQTSALQRARPQFLPLILKTWTSFSKPSPPAHLSALQARFIEKSIRIQLVAVAKMQLQSSQTQALTKVLAGYGIKFSGGALSRSQQQQLLHLDRDNGDDSRRSSKRPRSSTQDNEDAESKRTKAEVDAQSKNAAPPPPPPPAPAPTPITAPALGAPSGSAFIPPGSGQALLGQINIAQLPLHHVVDVIFETLAANTVPQLFHSFLSALPVMPLKMGPLPIPPPGVGPPPPGLLLQRPLPPGMMMPPPVGHFPLPPPHMMPHLGPSGQPMVPGIKQEPNLAKLQLPTVTDNTNVKVVVLPAKHTPIRLPSRPVVVKSDAVTIGEAPRIKPEQNEVKVEPKVAPEVTQQLLKQETFQVKPFEPADTRPVDPSQPLAKDLLKVTFLRILASESLLSVPGATGRKLLEATAMEHRTDIPKDEDDAMVPFSHSDQDQTKVVTKADWMTIIARLLTRAFPRGQSASSSSGANQDMKDMMVNYICEDFKQRRELALIWLHEEWYYDGMCSRMESGASRDPQYLWCLQKILEGVTHGTHQLDTRDRGLSRFLLEVPELPESSVEILRTYCDDAARVQLGMSCLRDVVNLRPPSRHRALDIVLEYTDHPQKLQRSMAIVTAKKWYLEHDVAGPRVEAYALSHLESLKDYVVPKREASVPTTSSSLVTDSNEVGGIKDVKMESSDASWRPLGDGTAPQAKAETKDVDMSEVHAQEAIKTVVPTLPAGPSLADAEEDIGRLLELYFSLCAKNHGLLGLLFEHYISYDPFIQRVIRQKILPLIKSIKSDSVKLLALIRNFPMGAEMLVLRIIVILTDGARPSPGLVSAVQGAVVQHDLNARFLVPIVSGLNKEEVLASLPRIVSLLKGTERERKTVSDVFLKLLTGSGQLGVTGPAGQNALPTANRRNSNLPGPPTESTLQVAQLPSNSGARGSILSPSELLIELHSMEDAVGWKAACEAMDICFNHPEIYKSEIIAVVLQQLLDQPTIPSLFMRTVIQAITLYKNLVGFVNSMILTKLVQKKVWTRPVLWKGFIRCSKMMQPSSSSVLSSLPKPQLKEVWAAEPSLKEPVEAYMKAKASGRRVGGGVTKQVNLHASTQNEVKKEPVDSKQDAADVQVKEEQIPVEIEEAKPVVDDS